MNYLAHVFLAEKNPEIILGNLLEDFVKGNIEHPRNDLYSKDLKIGLKMHRMIDTFTDSHSNVKMFTNTFKPKFSKYSSIIVDVIFDHFLIMNWTSFTDESFEDFRKRIYKALVLNRTIQPLSFQKRIDSMIEHDWLKNYAEIWGLKRAFVDINQRINRPDIDLTNSIVVFQKNYDFIQENFKLFFFELQNECKLFLTAHGQ